MKYHNVLQQNEEDCAAACLASVAKHYGRIFSNSRIREAIGTGQLGTTLLGLWRGAEVLGFNARAGQAPPEAIDDIEELPLPAIIHWKGYHYVVLYGRRRRKYVIADPSVGIRYLNRQELAEGWTQGTMLLLEPDPVHFFEQENDRTNSLQRFLAPIWNYRSILSEALLINLFVGLLSLALPFLIQILTDDVLVRGDRDLLASIAIVVVFMQLMSSGLQLVQSNLISHFAQRLELGLVLEFGQKLLRLPLAYYESHRSGEIISRLRDIEDINQLISQVVISLPSQLFIAIVSFSLMLFYSSKLALVSVTIAAIMTISTILLLPTLKHRIRNYLVLEAENQGVLVETFKGAMTLKSISAAPQVWQEFQSRFGKLANVGFKTIQISIVNRTFSTLISRLGNIALLWFGSSLVINKELSIGQLLAFNSMNDNFLSFILFLIRFVSEYIRTSTAVERLAEIIDASPETSTNPQTSFAIIAENAEIDCREISFHHAGRVELLADFSLTIPGGKITALIGKSGCGKSTLAKLIAGLYRSHSGNIRIGKYNVGDLSLDCLRQQVMLVPQEAFFWSRSIVDNFRLKDPYLPLEKIIDACKIADADNFISRLPDKYHTILGEFGANISGGQRQRLALARAIVTDPPILILDESTSGLDPVSEEEVLDKLFAHREGKTTILISHRPTVIARAEYIIFLEEGKLQMQGSIADIQLQAGTHQKFLLAQ
jgi:ATP-binding cassette, subfamily C, bacterial